ncbi:hypothetical protein V7152_08015 [Neobacillus drentensis]|uniref:hypothetical protein n=1 Tax=Neobacillus drentensis TaxID=220684 RepID=UPI003000105A
MESQENENNDLVNQVYENNEYGFSLSIPDEWDNHYVVDEFEKGSDHIISFRYRFDNRIFKDTIMSIIITNKTKEEIDLENQESTFPTKFITTNNGKSFLYEYNVGDPSNEIINEPIALEGLVKLINTVPKTIQTFRKY